MHAHLKHGTLDTFAFNLNIQILDVPIIHILKWNDIVLTYTATILLPHINLTANFLIFLVLTYKHSLNINFPKYQL